MPAVWGRTMKVEQILWQRLGQEFCDGCGMLIKDDHFYKLAVVTLDENLQLDLSLRLNSHISPFCTGLVLAQQFAACEHSPE